MALEPLSPASRLGGAERKRIPMSVPVQRLSVPDIPGYHLHWFLGTAERINRALSGGYEFVDEEETTMNDAGLGGTSTRTGNTDLGSRVSVISGQQVTNGQPVRLILMKLRQELFEEDQLLVEERNDQVVQSLFRGTQGAGGHDASHRYVDRDRTNIPDFFKRKAARP